MLRYDGCRIVPRSWSNQSWTKLAGKRGPVRPLERKEEGGWGPAGLLRQLKPGCFAHFLHLLCMVFIGFFYRHQLCQSSLVQWYRFSPCVRVPWFRFSIVGFYYFLFSFRVFTQHFCCYSQSECLALAYKNVMRNRIVGNGNNLIYG